jgi:hypothetical protein
MSFVEAVLRVWLTHAVKSKSETELRSYGGHVTWLAKQDNSRGLSLCAVPSLTERRDY